VGPPEGADFLERLPSGRQTHHLPTHACVHAPRDSQPVRRHDEDKGSQERGMENGVQGICKQDAFFRC
jgi:hypothetical protein